MKKNYFLKTVPVITCAVFTCAAYAASITTEVDLTQGTSQVMNEGTVSEVEITGAGILQETHLFTISQSNCGGAGTKPVWKFDGEYASSQYVDKSAYVEINMLGNADLKSIALDGISGEVTHLIIGFSQETESISRQWESYTGGIVFGDEFDGITLLGCTQQEIEAPAGTKSIRIVRTSTDFAGQAAFDYSPAYLKEFKITTEYIPTGMEEVPLDELAINKSGDRLYVSYPAEIEIYSISGHLILSTGTAVESVSINELPQGIYMVKARKPNGKTVVKKVVR